MIEELTKEASEAYGKIITRYPAMDRALDAKARLEALHQPVPRPTRAMLEQNKKEMASRQQTGFMSSMMGNLERHPGVAKASRVGEPTMVDPEPITATGEVQQIAKAVGGGGGDNKLRVVTTGLGAGGPNQEAPRSDAPVAASDTPAATEQPAEAAGTAPATAELTPNVADPNELKPNVAPDPNALPPLQQTNQLDGNGGAPSAASSNGPAKCEELADISSSKKKRKRVWAS